MDVLHHSFLISFFNDGSEVGLDAGTDVRALVLLWRLGSKERPGELSKQEFVAGAFKCLQPWVKTGVPISCLSHVSISPNLRGRAQRALVI